MGLYRHRRQDYMDRRTARGDRCCQKGKQFPTHLEWKDIWMDQVQTMAPGHRHLQRTDRRALTLEELEYQVRGFDDLKLVGAHAARP
jgi:hypothetical protein